MMNGRLIRRLFEAFPVAIVSFGAHAQCSPGTILYHTPTNSYCGPDPSYNPQQKPQKLLEIWQDRYGAIATDGPNGITASATEMRSEGKAKAAALTNCYAEGGVSCKVDITFKNGCGVVTTSDTKYAASVGANINEASDVGLRNCRSWGDQNCRVYYRVCSLPVRVQ